MFNLKNYPKSYSSMQLDDFRLKNFLDKPPEELIRIESQLWKFVISRLEQVKPIKEYKDYEYVDSGWEFSVFEKDNDTVVKIPSGVFPEVNDLRYLENVKYAYETIKEFFPKG